jgi:hypothetical protein
LNLMPAPPISPLPSMRMFVILWRRWGERVILNARKCFGHKNWNVFLLYIRSSISIYLYVFLVTRLQHLKKEQEHQEKYGKHTCATYIRRHTTIRFIRPIPGLPGTITVFALGTHVSVGRTYRRGLPFRHGQASRGIDVLILSEQILGMP